jgi:hypothetical protein
VLERAAGLAALDRQAVLQAGVEEAGVDLVDVELGERRR